MFTCLDASPFDFVDVLVQVPCVLARMFHVCFNKLYTASKLLVRKSIWTSTVFSTLLYDSQSRTFPAPAQNLLRC